MTADDRVLFEVDADRRMDHDIAAVLALLRADLLPLGDVDFPADATQVRP